MLEYLRWIAIAGLLGGLAAIVGLWVRNYSRHGNAPHATRQTSRMVFGVFMGAVLSLAVLFSEAAGIIGVFGELAATWPGSIGQLILGFLAIAGVAGWIELSVVGMTIAVALVLLVYAGIRNR